jgi:hypothetical protein
MVSLLANRGSVTLGFAPIDKREISGQIGSIFAPMVKEWIAKEDFGRNRAGQVAGVVGTINF